MLELQEIPFFSQFSFEELVTVRQAVELQEFVPGAVLCRKGETGRFLFAIASGGVKVLTTDGHGIYHGPGQLVGEMSILSGLPISATTVATKTTSVYALAKETLQGLLESKPLLYRTFTEMLASRMRQSPSDRSPQAPTCVVIGCLGPVSECYAFARTLFGQISKHAPHSIYCQFHQPGDSATAVAPLDKKIDAPSFIKELDRVERINDVNLNGHFGVLMHGEPLQSVELIKEWRGFGAYGQCLVLALPWKHVMGLESYLDRRDAVICLVPPGSSPDLDSTPVGDSLGKADYAMVTLTRGKLSSAPPRGRRWSFVFDVAGWEPRAEQPIESVLEKQVGRLARWSTGCAIGLSMGSGGARGFAHLGVLKVLEDAKIPIDCMTGTSIGGIIALAYSLVGSADATIDLTRKWLGKKKNVVDAFNSLGASLVPGRRIRKVANAVYGNTQFADLPIPVTTVGTDLVTGEKVIMDEGSAVEAALGTSAIPGFFPPVRWENRYVIDGANVSRIPVDQLDKYRCGAKIAVNVAPLPGSEKMGEAAIRKNFFSFLGFRNIWLRSWELQAYWHGSQEASHADVILEPDTRRFAMLDFDRFDDLLEEGIRTATDKLAEIEGVVSSNSRPGETQL